MKKSILCCLLLSAFFALSCFAREGKWAIEEYQVNGYYGYKITQAPDAFKEFTGSTIIYQSSQRNAVYLWPVSHKDEIEKYLSENDLLEKSSRWGDKFLFLPHGFFVTEINQDDLSYIWDILSTKYAGFAEMQQKDFIILDARSNRGGDNAPLFSFRNYLNNIDYKGTVICLQDNWLGEGKGYEPQIWATTETMKETLEKLGVILDDVVFR